MSQTNLWQETLTTLLLGTERKPFTTLVADDGLGQVLARVPSDSAEAQLWTTVAITSIYRSAGQLPVKGATVATSTVVTSDQRPSCPSLAVRSLRELTEKNDTTQLQEWLTLAQAAGCRLPEEYLPMLLDLGGRNTELRAQLIAVAGASGQWLAMQNPAWDYAALQDAPEIIWQTGRRPRRLALLQHLRTSQPDPARDLLASTWGEEKAEDRSAFLSTFQQALSLADEAFLEAALTDRSKEVRQLAAELLAQLPTSSLCQRMVERLRPLIQVIPGRRRALLFTEKPRIEVLLPNACDAAMQRDGIEAKPPKPWGEKAWWLSQIIAATPLDYWRQPEITNPEQWLSLLEGNEWRDAIIDGWVMAARRQKHGAWIQALFNGWLEKQYTLQPDELLMALPIAERSLYVLEMLRRNPTLEDDRPARRLLDHCHFAWDAALSRTILTLAIQYLQKYSLEHPGTFAYFLQHAARFLHPSQAELVAQLDRAVPRPSTWVNAIEKLTTTFEFRRQMYEALNVERRT